MTRPVHPFAALVNAVVVSLDRELTRPELERMIRTQDRRPSCQGVGDVDHDAETDEGA